MNELSRRPRGQASRLTKAEKRTVLSTLKTAALDGNVEAAATLVRLEIAEKTAPATESRKTQFQIDFQDCEQGATP